MTHTPPPDNDRGFVVTSMAHELSRFSFWFGEAYFWVFMAIASWTALSGAPWTVALWIGGALTLGNLLARWGEWREMIRLHDHAMMVLNWLAVYAWQATVILITFAVARYLRRFVPDAVLFRTLDSWTPILIVLFAMALVFGLIRMIDDTLRAKRKAAAEEAAFQAARKAPMAHPALPAPSATFVVDTDDGPKRIDVDPIKLDQLYLRYHESHAYWTHARKNTGLAKLDDAEGSAAKLADVQTRLGIALPEALCQCYATQNGGFAGEVALHTDAGWTADQLTFAPLEQLRTLRMQIGEDAETAIPHPDQTVIIDDDEFHLLLLDAKTGEVFLQVGEDGYYGPPLGYDPPDYRWPDWSTFMAGMHRVVYPFAAS